MKVSGGWLPAAVIAYHGKPPPPEKFWLQLELCDTTSSLHIMILSQNTLGIDTSNVHVHMINDLHKIARTPFYVKMQFY